MHKTLIAGYEASRTTWQEWVKNEGSTPDLKLAHFIQMSGTGYLDEYVEGQGEAIAKGVTGSDAVMNIQNKRNRVPIGWFLMANDDLGGLAYIPAELGKSANKTINLACLAELMGNQPVDEDGQPLFGSHTTYVEGNPVAQNNDLSLGAPSLSNVSSMMKTMGTFLGKDGTPIRIQGRYLLTPYTLDKEIRQICLSQYDPSQNQFQTYNPYNTLLPLTEPLLDMFNAAQNGTPNYHVLLPELQDSPVRIKYLRGMEMPVITSFIDLHTDCMIVKVAQSFGTRAIDFRRVVRNH